MENRSYIAFISYRHMPLDKQAAELVQKKIEHYTVPKEFREQAGGRHLGKVFRDEDELPASSSLSNSITYALDHTEYLIVICTPDLPKSRWCEQEIRYFLQTHDRDHVLAVLADGEPEESFSPYLRYSFDEEGNARAEIEPLAANIAGANHTIDRKKLNKEIVRIYAALLGCPFDALWQRERRYRTNRLLMGAGALIAAMSVFLGIVLYKNAQITEQNNKIASQNETLEEQNAQISEQNLALEENNSTLMVDKGRLQLDNYDLKGALESALAAAPGVPGAPYDHRVQKLLFDALGAYESDQRYKAELVSYPMEIKQLLSLDDTVITADYFGTISRYALDGGALLWRSVPPEQTDGSDGSDYNVWFYALPEEDILLCCETDAVRALSLTDGTLLWRYAHTGTYYGGFLSDDQKMLAIFETDRNYLSETYNQSFLRFLDPATGAELNNCALSYENDTPTLRSYLNRPVLNADFSDDGRYFAYGIYVEPDSSSQTDEDAPVNRYLFEVLDLQTGERTLLGSYKNEKYYGNILLYGLRCSDDGKSLYTALYDQNLQSVVSILYTAEPTPDGTVPHWSTKQKLLRNNLFKVIEPPEVPALCSDSTAVLFVENMFYLFRLDTADLVGQMIIPGNVVYAAWDNANKTAFRMITDDGTDWKFSLDTSWNYTFSDCFIEDWEQGASLSLAVPYGDALGDVCFTDETDAGRIYKLSKRSDPYVTPMNFSNRSASVTSVSGKTVTAKSPSGNRLFMLVNDQGSGCTLYAYDAQTLARTHAAAFPDLPFDYAAGVTAADEEHLQYDHTLLGLDGSIEYSQEIQPEDLRRSVISDRFTHAVRLSSGDVAVVGSEGGNTNPTSLFYDFYRIVVWLNGEKQSYTMGVKSYASYDLFDTGENGWALSHAPLVSINPSTGLWEYDEADTAYHALNLQTGDVKTIENRAALSGRQALAMGRKTPVFAAADADGCLRLYSIETGACELLSDAYTGGSVYRMAFTQEDDYLIVYSFGGLLEIYRMDDRSLCFSETVLLTDQVMNIWKLRADADNMYHELVITAGYRAGDFTLVQIDLESFVVAGQTTHVVDCLLNTRKVLTAHGINLSAFPLYALSDLTAWAEEALREEK